MARFASLHEIVTDPVDVPNAIRVIEAFVLRGLGFEGKLPA
jgi:hypothetical protein